jgi:hypothetical protein
MSSLQILIDGQWVDVARGVTRFQFHVEAEPEPEPEPVHTPQEWSMTLEGDGLIDFADAIRREYTLAGWRSRPWLTTPYEYRLAGRCPVRLG